MQQTNGLLHHQNFMLAVRRELGWPAFKPCNDAIAFSSGRTMDIAQGLQMARIAEQMRKDAVYTGWADASAKEPTGFAIVFRHLLTVDVIDRVIPYAANDTSPIVFVSTRGDEHFAVDGRGSLARLPGKPKAIGRGCKLAMKRIKATAATMGDKLLGNNTQVPVNGDWVEPDAVPIEMIVRFN